MIRPAILALSLAIAPLPALAHKLIMGIFPSGNQIEGELGFSSGDAPEGQLIEVFDKAGDKLGETVTDADGFFLFTPSEPVSHRFRADMGAGHVAERVMLAEEVAPIVAKSNGSAAATISWTDKPVAAAQPETSASAPAVTATTPQVVPQVVVAALNQAELDAIAKAVRDETRPLRQEIAAYKEKNDLQTILGGIGYIVGLFGFGFYIAARRKLKDAA
ncbi:hypothetical protein [Aliiruegeria lutimaris]|uniref:Nickel transport protein n=1 Tax=Aliiruegeria lutimaris TaxID=571298 RepID=A0A1G8K3P3_9RHOB|nr:hypothetical protein [Aliiruegeria lutimaris]SDI38062.1 nickel transport protein [Aliiruegeria lutimaris]